MSQVYQALYRKCRPQTFDTVVGQEHITETLKNQVSAGRLSHAYLFIGTRGTGKTTCARILAKAVNCTSPVNGNPCCRCEACLSIAEGTATDVVEIDAASNNGVDNVRALREEAVYSPTNLKKRVYIIDEVHMLSLSAFNALLKILEEPPEHLMFILATTELQKVPATILSRCQRHSFKRLDNQTLADYVFKIARQENIPADAGACAAIANLAEGGVRDALSLLDQCSGSGEAVTADTVCESLGLTGIRKTSELLEGILQHDTGRVVNDFNSLWLDGRDPSGVLDELRGLFRDVMVYHVVPKTGKNVFHSLYDDVQLKHFADALSIEEITAAMASIQQSLDNMKYAKNPKAAAELCLISLASSLVGDTAAALRGRLASLEAQVKQLNAKLENGEFTARRPAAAQPGAISSAPFVPQPEPEENLPWAPEESYAPAVAMANPFIEPDVPYTAPAVDSPAMPEPVEEYIPASETKQEAPVQVANVSDEQVNEALLHALPKDLQLALGKELTWTLAGDVLKMETDFFRLGRLKTGTLLTALESTISQLFGHEMRVTAVEKKEEPAVTETRDINELKKFPEVYFS
ncbi:MAG: DNA polymerase III subunit gamma/tau [Oscillospiraceae bacterium]|nr:DNA polymerase III subunit gamma/tau [Oscillospiraceae bacterium]